MAANQTRCTILEQSYFLRFLVSEKSKPFEIWEIMSDDYGEEYFRKIFL